MVNTCAEHWMKNDLILLSIEYHDWNMKIISFFFYRIALLINVVCCVGRRYLFYEPNVLPFFLYLGVWCVRSSLNFNTQNFERKKNTSFFHRITVVVSVGFCVRFRFRSLLGLSVWSAWRTRDWRLTKCWFGFWFSMCWMKNNATRFAFHSLSGNAFFCAQPNFIIA